MATVMAEARMVALYPHPRRAKSSLIKLMKENYQNQMKLSQLRILVAVADSASFSEAALQLEMSQSAVSHAIAALEEHLGVVLVVRGRHGARLTPVGKQISDLSREVIERTDAIIHAAAAERSLKGGQIRIAAFRSVASHFLPPVIAQFHQKYPETMVSLMEYIDHLQVEEALRHGDADVGLTLMPVQDDLEAWEILQDEFVALLPPNFQLAGQELTWQELAAQPLIMPAQESAMMRQVYDHAQAMGYPLEAAYTVRTDSTIVNLVAQGLGASILPRLAAYPIPNSVQIYALPTPLKRSIGAAILAEKLYSPVVFAFIDLLKQHSEFN